MITIIGVFIVIGSIVGGFLMHQGNLNVLLQPSEFLIILGAGFGSLLIMAPPKLLKQIVSALPEIFKASNSGKEISLEFLTMLYEILSKIKRDGALAIEPDIERPHESLLFTKYPHFLENNAARSLLCDTLRLVLLGASIRPYDLDDMMNIEIESFDESEGRVSGAVLTLADAFPGLGIVAAVLGVIITMGKMDQSPAIIGHSIAAALVGTFLGVLMCYGIVGPIGKRMENNHQLGRRLLEVIKASLMAYAKDIPPRIAVEFGRRVLLKDEKPNYAEVEEALKKIRNER